MSFPEMWYGSVCQDGVHPRPAVVSNVFQAVKSPNSMSRPMEVLNDGKLMGKCGEISL